mmetsp:Transcript_37506/g.116673  ORF Transcript_37506/g.116673 Transcript_37506/m.116673 type:complete len:288 (-) Transcript_37506:95-958(-)
MAANTANIFDERTALDLANIRKTLMRMEDSIIFSLIERSQFKLNSAVYAADCPQLGDFKLHQLKAAGSDGCLGDWFIYQTECLQSQVGRYDHPTEYSFFGPLPEPYLGGLSAGYTGKRKGTEGLLAPVPQSAIVNKRLLDIYRREMLPKLCEEGDCGNHGSTAVQDVVCLQTMCTRIYYGLFVAEAKFRDENEKARRLIKARDRDGLMAFITKPEVEERNIRRVTLKARTFSQNITQGEADQPQATPSDGTTYKIDPEYIGVVFRDFLMPLTKDIEVEYLLARLDYE